ncbi:hypothetical protein CHS0354_009595 [Potamilus streckersoni]|uniref:Uncharacterized protein n=1 Tax=Potamilus streckersoni TaxID=2493646 RepID=A0AAE0SPV4_9BIVA|nr:hypothetical protein CHS0354_009595 [Potamilus streckersoni]
MVSDYWLMQTDYTWYAEVYGCRQQNVLGQCIYPDSWVWSRTPQLTVDQWAVVNATIENLCLQEANFLATQQVNASMLSDYWVRQTDYTVYAVVYGCREQNLLGQCTYPDSWVWSRTPQLNADQWAIVNTAIDSLCLQEAMFLATEQANASMVSDYWVRQTDYTGYAVVYGCREQNFAGPMYLPRFVGLEPDSTAQC